MNEVYSYLDNNIKLNNNDYIVVAVSYGPDSMALLSILKNKYDNAKIICTHVHHNHRKESDQEALDLKKYCDTNDIIFEMIKIDKYSNDKFTEEEARNIRYAFFDGIIKKYNAKYLFTAHHGDDLVETVLMRLTRGSTLKGYSGISPSSEKEEYQIIRPLLFVTKNELITYCNENNIPYAVDKSNEELDYTRNRYRAKVLPFLKEENKDVHLKFLKFSSILLEYEEHVKKEVEIAFNEVVEDDKLNINKLLKFDDLIIKKIIEKYLLSIYKDDISCITSNHVLLILKLIRLNTSNSKVSLPNNIIMIKSYNYLYFDKEDGYNDYCFIFEDYLELPNNCVIEKINSLENTTNYICALDSSTLSLPLYVRNRLDGDKIEVLNLNGSKKIKDIFIDEKLDITKRNNYPVLCDSLGKILWIPGVKKSKYDKSKQGKYDIILKYREKGGI